MLDWLWQWLEDAWQWIYEFLMWLPLKLYQLFLEAIAVIVAAIPVPDWVGDLNMAWVPSSMAYFLEPFNIPLAISCITGGYLLRFLIRRIPIIG